MGKHFVGLDASARSVNICIVDANGQVVHERKMGVDPEAIATHILGLALDIERIGLEAGMLSQYLYAGLAAAALPIICVETRHMKAALSAQLNKTDRHDARGIAQMMRVGLYKVVHVKTPTSQRIRTVSLRVSCCGQSSSTWKTKFEDSSEILVTISARSPRVTLSGECENSPATPI